MSAARTIEPHALEVEQLCWTGPHGLSMGGSHKGVHLAASIGYWVHDTLAATNTRFHVYRMGINAPVAKARTLEAAKRAAQDEFKAAINAALAKARGEA